jgi:hypothetical protein
VCQKINNYMLSFKGEEPKAITHSCPMAQAMLGSSDAAGEAQPISSKAVNGGHVHSATERSSAAEFSQPKGSVST